MEYRDEQCGNRKGCSHVIASFVYWIPVVVFWARARLLLRKRRRPDPIARDAKVSSEPRSLVRLTAWSFKDIVDFSRVSSRHRRCVSPASRYCRS